MRNGGSIFEYKIFDAMVVKSKDKFINILPNSLKEREQIKKYFWIKKRKNIDKAKKVLYII